MLPLWKLDQTTLEQDVLDQHLRKRGYKSLAHAVESNDQEGSTGEGWLADGGCRAGNVQTTFATTV